VPAPPPRLWCDRREPCPRHHPVCGAIGVNRVTDTAPETLAGDGFPFGVVRRPLWDMKLDDELNELAATQEGLVTVQQLRSAGVSPWTQRVLVADGWMHRIAPRVYAVRGAPDTHRQRLRAGLLCLGERSWISHEAAAALHGLDRSSQTAVEFTVDRTRRPRVIPFVVHSTTRLSPVDHVVVDGFRVMSATRTIFDLALARAHPRRIEAAIDSAVRLQLSAPEVLARRLPDLRGSGRWGCRLVEEMITDSGGHTMLERRFLELAREAGLPRPRTQVVLQEGGRHIARVDFLFDSAAAVVEVSGQKGHASPGERARDAQRRNELQDLGFRVFEYTWNDVTQRPGWVRTTLRARLTPEGPMPASA